MMDILQHYQRYVPVRADSSPLKTVLYGDGLSCERARNAKEGRAADVNAWERLEALEPIPTDWHLRMHILEVSFINIEISH